MYIRTKSNGYILHNLSKECTDMLTISSLRELRTLHKEVELFSHLSPNLVSKSFVKQLNCVNIAI